MNLAIQSLRQCNARSPCLSKVSNESGSLRGASCPNCESFLPAFPRKIHSQYVAIPPGRLDMADELYSRLDRTNGTPMHVAYGRRQ